MPLPIILGVGAAIAGAVGVGSGIHGASKMKEANDTMKSAEERHKRNNAKLERCNKAANEEMDKLGVLELNILNGLDKFADMIEQIQNRPQFKDIKIEGVELPKYNKEELQEVSVGAGVLLGGLGGAAAGTAGGFAAAGATTSAVMALGTASTGTAIASLSGAAATNATLAALGGGALSAGGGGMALGSAVLGGATLGAGLLEAGVSFNVTGSKLSDKADEAWHQMKKAEDTINKICNYLDDLKGTAKTYITSLESVNKAYTNMNREVSYTIYALGKVDWNKFSEEEKIAIKNSILLVGLLRKMCKVSLVKKAEVSDEMNEVNQVEVDRTIQESRQVLGNLGLQV